MKFKYELVEKRSRPEEAAKAFDDLPINILMSAKERGSLAVAAYRPGPPPISFRVIKDGDAEPNQAEPINYYSFRFMEEVACFHDTATDTDHYARVKAWYCIETGTFPRSVWFAWVDNKSDKFTIPQQQLREAALSIAAFKGYTYP